MAYASALAVLADPTRRAVVEKLAQGPASVTEIAGSFAISRPAVSQHLRALREAGLVTVEQSGTRRIYSVRSETIGELRAYLDRMWGDILAQIDGDR